MTQENDVEDIAALVQRHDMFIKTHKLLRQKYEQTNAPRYKQMASLALTEAGKILKRIDKMATDAAKRDD